MKKLTKGQQRVLRRALNGDSLPDPSHIVNKLKKRGLIWSYWSTDKAERALRVTQHNQCKRRKKGRK